MRVWPDDREFRPLCGRTSEGRFGSVVVSASVDRRYGGAIGMAALFGTSPRNARPA